MSHPKVDLATKIPITARHREKIPNLFAVPLAVLGLLVRLSASLEKPMVDDRSPTAKAMSIVSQITTIGLLAIMPMAIGSWVDGWLGWKPILTLLGVGMGLTAAGFELMRLVWTLEANKKTKQK